MSVAAHIKNTTKSRITTKELKLAMRPTRLVRFSFIRTSSILLHRCSKYCIYLDILIGRSESHFTGWFRNFSFEAVSSILRPVVNYATARYPLRGVKWYGPAEREEVP